MANCPTDPGPPTRRRTAMLQWGCANLLDCDFVLRGIEKCPTEAQRTGTMGFFPLHLLHDAIVILQWRSNINMRNAPHGPAPSITKHLLYGRCRGITIAAEPRSRRTGFPAVKLLRERYITATVWTPHKIAAQDRSICNSSSVQCGLDTCNSAKQPDLPPHPLLR